MVQCRGIRGATTVGANTREEILSATREMLERMASRNDVVADDIAAVFFTVTEDLDAEYPAMAARQLGWLDVALLCAREIPVPELRVQRCIRVLMLVNTSLAANQIRHVYLRDAVALRPSRADVDVPGTEPTLQMSRAAD